MALSTQLNSKVMSNGNGLKKKEIAGQFQERAIISAREIMVKNIKQYQRNYFNVKLLSRNDVGPYYDNLPLVYFVDVLVCPDLYPECERGTYLNSSELFDLNKYSFEKISNVLFGVLDMMDEDPRISGKLTSIFKKDEQLRRELIEVLCMCQTHPSREHILFQEKTDNVKSERSTRRSLLHELSINGRNAEIRLAIDVFMEYAEKQAALKSLEKLPPLDKIMQELWILIDINEDDTLDQGEVREFTRLLLSRPMLGKLMIAMVAADEVNSSWLAGQEAQALLPTLIGDAVSDMAERIFSVSRSLWEQLDKDLDGKISEQEFCNLLPLGFLKAIAIPLSAQLAKAGKERLAVRNETSQKQTFFRQDLNGMEDMDDHLDDALENLNDLRDVVGEKHEEHHRNCVGALGSSFHCWDVQEIETDKKFKQKKSAQRFADVSDLRELECDEWNDEERKHLRDQRAASEMVKDSSHEDCKPGCDVKPGCSIM